MTDKDMKQLLKNAYQISPSVRERDFLKMYENRSMHIWDVFVLEIKYMGIRSILSGVMLILVIGLIYLSENPQLMWYVSGILPVVGLLLISGLGKSERYGMQELEGVARFSVCAVKAIRIFIVGGISLIIVTAISVLLQGKTGVGFMTILGFIGTPYMLNAWGNLMITRRLHGKDNLYGCLAVAGVSCMLPMLMEKAIQLGVIQPIVILLVLAAAFALTVRESVLYIKEREDLSWNLS